MCPATSSIAMPSGCRHPVTSVRTPDAPVSREKMRPPLRSSTNNLPWLVLEGLELLGFWEVEGMVTPVQRDFGSGGAEYRVARERSRRISQQDSASSHTPH